MAEWWDSLTPYKMNNGLPAKGTLTGGLVVLERLQSKYVLDLDQHRTKGKSQIKGAGRTQTRKILARFGETRPFSEESGRTNRGLAGEIATLLDALRVADLDGLSVGDRNDILRAAQEWLAQKAGEYFNRARVKFTFNPDKTAFHSLGEILEQAQSVGKEGQVAQYLVGAKLALRFPTITIRNDSYSTSDIQSGSPGDFRVNDTAFHVTVAPNIGHLEKCKSNIQQGLRAYVLVPDRLLMGTRQNAELMLPEKITVQSIESFVSQNIEELALFAKDGLISGFRRLLETYNERVDDAEIDKSMLIEIPKNLQP